MKIVSSICLLIISIHGSGQQVINIRLGNGGAIPSTPAPNTSGIHLNGYGNYVTNGTDSMAEQSKKFYSDVLSRAALTVTSNDTTGSSTYNASTGVLNIPRYSTTSGIVTDYNYYLSSYGNNGSSGTGKLTPKASLRSMDTLINNSTLPIVKIAIQGGSSFNEENIPLTRANVIVSAYDRDKAGATRLPTFSGTTIHNSGWTLTGSNTYQKSITNTIASGTGSGITLGSYSYMYVIEIDTLLEKTAPLTARRYLHLVASVAAVDTVAGSYYCPVSTPAASPTLISFHTYNGASPNNNPRYRYEVVTKAGVVSFPGGQPNYGNGMTIQYLSAVDFGAGVGPFGNTNSATDSNYLDHVYIQGSAIHQGVYGCNSTINASAFVAGDPTIPSQIPIVFYKTVAPGNDVNTVQNSIFLDNPSAVYTHTNDALSHHGKLVVKNSYIFRTGYGVGAGGPAITSSNCDTLDVNYLYSDSSNNLVSSNANFCYIRNSINRNCATLNYHSKNVFIDNVLYKSQRTQSSAFLYGTATSDHLSVSNSIIHIKNYVPSASEGGRVFNNQDTSSRTTSKHNVIIGETPTGNYITFAYANTWGGAGTGPDIHNFNVYILVSGFARWQVTNASTNGGNPYISDFATWKTQSGQDGNSIFIDLRGFSSGLKRIYVDPDNGNYNYTDSPQADSVKAVVDGAIRAGMRTPPGSFMSIPSREQVFDMVENDKIPSVAAFMFTGNAGGVNYIQVERMTTAQRTAIVGPIEEGRQIFDTDLHKRYEWSGSSWNALW